jgi:hypothetical protein
VNRGDERGSATGRELGMRVSRLILRRRGAPSRRMGRRVPSCFETPRHGVSMTRVNAFKARLFSMRAGEGGALWANEAGEPYAESSPRKRGPMITGRWLWVRALRPLRGRRPGRQSFIRAKDQPAGAEKWRGGWLPVSGLFFTGSCATAARGADTGIEIWRVSRHILRRQA